MKNKQVGFIVKIGLLVMSTNLTHAMSIESVKQKARAGADKVCPWIVGTGAVVSVAEAAGTAFASDQALNQPASRPLSLTVATLQAAMAGCAAHYATRNASTKQ